MKVSYFCLILFTLSQFVNAARKPDVTHKRNIKSNYVSSVCSNVASDYEFGSHIKSSRTKQCSYEPMLGTILICMANEMGPKTKGFQKSLKSMISTCERAKKNFTIDDLNKIYQNATNYVLDLNKSEQSIKQLQNVTYYQPIIMAGHDVKDWMRYYKSNYFNLDNASVFAGIMWCYFFGIFILIGVSNFAKRLGYHRRINNKFTKWFRSNISMPGLFNGKHTDPPQFLKLFAGLIPTRLESIIVVGFLGLNALFLGFHHDFGSPVYSKKRQVMRMVADRAGIMAFGLIPLLILFAGRNNIITSLTGIPFTSFIVFHKYVARMMWIHALIHSAGYLAYGVYADRMAHYLHRWYYRWGIVATLCGLILLIQALHCFRTRAYETFLVLHIILAVMFIIGCWYHCRYLGWVEWIYASWALWIFDRILRVVRMWMFGFRNAEIELIADDTFKLSVLHDNWFKPFPGAFAYVYFITPTTFWQSHPFTIIDSALNENETTIYIKTKAGVTNRINKFLSKSGNKLTVKICVEGPYGHRAPMEKYDTALLLAGGNGIPGPYYHAIDLAKRESCTKQEIKLLWVIRNPEAIAWFYKELKQLRNTPVQIDIYITGKTSPPKSLSSTVSNEIHDRCSEKEHSTSDNNSTEEPNEKKDQVQIYEESCIKYDHDSMISKLSSHVNFHYGRPDFNALLENEMIQQGKRDVAIMTCGPPKMVDSVRNIVAKKLMNAEGRVDLFEELQTW